MTLPKNAQELNLPPQNSTVVAITIAATTFVVHPEAPLVKPLGIWDGYWVAFERLKMFKV